MKSLRLGEALFGTKLTLKAVVAWVEQPFNSTTEMEREKKVTADQRKHLERQYL